MHDYDNYSNNYQDYFTKFDDIVSGKQPEIEASADWKVDNSELIEILTNRIKSIEKRLIDFDSDTPEERMKMRGELDGLRFALNYLR